MPDITRDIGQVQPNNYIKPGVQTPSPLGLAAELGGMAMEADRQHASNELGKQLDALHTQYETSAPGAASVQDDYLSPSDKAQVASVDKQLASNKAAVDQGTMTYDQYRIRGERLLRMAISKRPGLATEFRQVAEQHLGVDVVGASVDVLASWEHKTEAAMEEGARAKANAEAEALKAQVKLARAHLESVGVDTANMTDDQVMGEYPQHEQAIAEFLKQQATSTVIKTQRDTQDNSNAIRRPQATSQFVAESQKVKLDVYKAAMQLYTGYKSGQIKPGDLPAALTAAQADLSGRISTLRASMTAGDVDPDVAEKEIAGITELNNQLTALTSGKLGVDVINNRMEGIKLFVQNGMLENNQNVAVLSAASQLLGPEVFSTFVGPGGAFNKSAALALGDMITNTGDATTKAQNAGSVVSSVITTVLDRGGASSNPQAVPQMAKVLTNAGTSFVEMPQKDFKADYLTGPNGYITILNSHREALAKSVPDDAKSELLGAVSIAALTNYHALAASLYQKYPNLRGKLDFHLDTSTGDIVRPKAGASVNGVDASVLRAFNQAFAGKKVLQVFQTIGGYSPEDAKNLMYSGETEYQKQKAAAAKKPKSANWWENFSD